MAEAIDDGTTSSVRRMSRLVEAFHSVTYYSPEILGLTEHGYRGWWHAYFAYRPAPMGAVSAGTVTAAFYNFAPRMVERALPGVWEIMSPAAITELRLGLVDKALRRCYGDGIGTPEMERAATLLRQAVDGTDVAGRPVYGGYATLPWPGEPHLDLWHGCTLLREYRGDNHNIALAAACVGGLESHILMAAHGHGNMATILGIRGFTEDEWANAVHSLGERGWVAADGAQTDAGRAARSDIERRTDELTSGALSRLGTDAIEELEFCLKPLVGHLITSGEVSGRWPPPAVMK